MVGVMFLVATIVFVIAHVIPGDPAALTHVRFLDDR